MDAWIDTYHAVQRLTRQGTYVFLTDSAVGEPEEDNLRHLVTNLGHDVPRDRVVPFLTSKHSLEYCASYAERAHQNGFPALVVLGGDKTLGVPRVVAHAWQLREFLRKRNPTLLLGGWANPHADAERQVDFLTAPEFLAEFYLTQVVSHHHVEALGGFIPVPAEGLAREFAAGATAEEICARTIRALLNLGARHFYISNLPIGRAQQVLASVLEKVGSGTGPG